MMNLKEVITDTNNLLWHYILREGFVFTAINHPANVYDAIVIKYPRDVACSSPRIEGSMHSLETQIDFINKYKIESALIIADKIDFITRCPGLKHLEIIPADSAGDGFDFSPVYAMPNIKSIHCATVYGCREQYSSVIDYSKCCGLEDIHVNASGHKNYNKVETLKSLGISGYKEPDLTNMFNSRVLDTLSITQCGIKSLDGLQKTDNMQCLYLYYNRALTDITALREVKKTIKALRIVNCPKISDFSVLGELENLELLELSGSNALPDLKFLKTMKMLNTFTFSMNVLDGDLTLCKNLSYVYSERNRKHYNVKDKELPKGRYSRGNKEIEEWRRLE